MTESLKISTPCIGVCLLSPDAEICYGCLRTIDEIEAWEKIGEPARLAIMAKLESRRDRLPEELR